MLEFKKYENGYALIKNGLEIIFYNKITDCYNFNVPTISSEDFEWFRDILH